MPPLNFPINRRGFMRVGSVGALAVITSGIGKIFSTSASATGAKTASTANKKLVKLTKLPVGGNHKFALASGEQAILFRTKSGVFAYSRTCTHEGCTVDYSSSNKQLACPCHGAAFDPFNGAKVLVGPANAPLTKIKVKIERDWVILV